MTPTPRRRLRLLIDVQADDPDSMRQALADISFWAYEKGAAIGQGSDCVTGGPSSGWIVRSEHRPEVTHESYFEAVEAWRRDLKDSADAAGLPSFDG